MKLHGNTPEERQAYRNAYLVAKKEQGAAFDPVAFDREFLSDRCAIIPTPTKAERVKGEEVGGDGMPDKVREVVAAIDGAINAYKIEHDINGIFAKEKNGILQFGACLMGICRDIIRPSKILKAGDAHNSYNTDMLILFIDILKERCAREGLPFNRGLYDYFTGISDAYRSEDLARLTSARVGLRERVLKEEYNASLTMAYGSEIGNMRNLNEREARPDTGKTDMARAVDAGSLRRLTG